MAIWVLGIKPMPLLWHRHKNFGLRAKHAPNTPLICLKQARFRTEPWLIFQFFMLTSLYQSTQNGALIGCKL